MRSDTLIQSFWLSLQALAFRHLLAKPAYSCQFHSPSRNKARGDQTHLCGAQSPLSGQALSGSCLWRTRSAQILLLDPHCHYQSCYLVCTWPHTAPTLAGYVSKKPWQAVAKYEATVAMRRRQAHSTACFVTFVLIVYAPYYPSQSWYF